MVAEARGEAMVVPPEWVLEGVAEALLEAVLAPAHLGPREVHVLGVMVLVPVYCVPGGLAPANVQTGQVP